MAAQLPREELGTAVGVLIWSFFCLSCSVLMGWLTWVHRERTSYVALFAYVPALATCASIAQQLHTIVRWRDIKIAQHHHTIKHLREPELAVTGASVGVDLVLFYIQFYCYNVLALLLLSWAASLTQSIFHVRRLNLHDSRMTNAAKLMSLLLPILFLSILRVDTIQKNTIAFFIIAHILMGIGMVGSMAFFLAILGKYIRSKVDFTSWNFPYGSHSGTGTGLTDVNISAPMAKRSIYDRWLLFRFTFALIAISAFEVFIIIFETTAVKRNQRAEVEDSPDLSRQRAHDDLIQFMSGVSPGVLALLVFGTTKALRAFMWDRFVPGFVKDRLQRRRRRTNDMIPLD